MITLYTITRQGTNNFYTFDNQANKFFQCDGTPLPVEALKCLAGPEQVSSFMHKPSIRVVLGRKCNFRCTYCHQSPGRYEDYTTNEKIDALVDKLTAQFPTGSVYNFWGGEPFLYLSTMRRMAQRLRDADPICQFAVLSNGSVMSAKVLKFLQDYGFQYGVSHDGPGQVLRTKDPFATKRQRELFKEANRTLPSFFINPVLSGANFDVFKIIDYFEEVFGEYVGLGDLGTIVPVDEKSAACTVSADNLKLLTRQMYKFLLSPRVHNYARGAFFVPMHDMAHHVVYGIPTPKNGYCVATNKNITTIDLDGNILPCQGAYLEDVDFLGRPVLRGNVFTGAEPWETFSWQQRKRCHLCPVLFFCRGACMLAKSDYFEQACEQRIHAYTPYLGALLTQMTGEVFVGFDGDFLTT